MMMMMMMNMRALTDLEEAFKQMISQLNIETNGYAISTCRDILNENLEGYAVSNCQGKADVDRTLRWRYLLYIS